MILIKEGAFDSVIKKTPKPQRQFRWAFFCGKMHGNCMATNFCVLTKGVFFVCVCAVFDRNREILKMDFKSICVMVFFTHRAFVSYIKSYFIKIVGLSRQKTVNDKKISMVPNIVSVSK